MINKQSTYSWVGEQTDCQDDKNERGKAAVKDGGSTRQEQNQRKENQRPKSVKGHLKKTTLGRLMNNFNNINEDRTCQSSPLSYFRHNGHT